MNTDMRTAPRTRTINLLMPMVEKSEWVTGKWSPVYDCWVSAWGFITLCHPIAWDELPEIPEELQGERALFHRPAITETEKADSALSVGTEKAA